MSNKYGLFRYVANYKLDMEKVRYKIIEDNFIVCVSCDIDRLVRYAQSEHYDLPIIVLDESKQSELITSYSEHYYIERVRDLDE